MSLTTTPKTANQLWGIYHTDREHAESSGDTLRTTIEASSKAAAEEAAARLGFSNPSAHPIASEVVSLVRSVIGKPPNRRREFIRKPARCIHV